MKKLRAAIWKELLLVLNDRVGLLLMYLMPLILVFLITIIQNSAFNLVKENRLKVLITNADKGHYGDSLIDAMKLSGGFEVVKISVEKSQLKQQTIDEAALMGLYIPPNYTASLEQNAAQISSTLLTDMGMETEKPQSQVEAQPLHLYFDPVVQENYRQTIQHGLQQLNSTIENKIMLEQLFSDLGYDKIPPHMLRSMKKNKTQWEIENAGLKDVKALIPNASQHNVPAWTIFAMFFMVISLGGSLVKERLSGSFMRLQTIPGAFSQVLMAKYIVYLMVAITQISVLFTIGRLVFPYLDLPPLTMPDAILPLIVVVILSGSAAISYAMLVGTYAKTQEQANGFGAVSIVIFAAIGGIWVPNFVMPEYLQSIGNISPLKWCLEGFYKLFLQNGNWQELVPSITFLILFTGICQLLIFAKLRIQNYI